MAAFRTTGSIAGALSGALLEQYRAQQAALGQYVAPLDPAVALGRLTAAMAQVFAQSYGLDVDAAQALAQLAAQATATPGAFQPSGSATAATRLAVILERCALQRAIVASGLASAVRPYLAAAAQGALEGFALDPSLVLAIDPATRRAHLPTLPPIHSQDASFEDVGPSPFFTERHP